MVITTVFSWRGAKGTSIEGRENNSGGNYCRAAGEGKGGGSRGK